MVPFPTDFKAYLVASVLLASVVVSVARVFSVYILAARVLFPKLDFLRADRQPWNLPRRVIAAVLATPLALYGLVAGIHNYDLGMGLFFAALTFLAMYSTCRTLWFTMDAAQEFLLLVEPYIRAIARLAIGFLVTYMLVVLGFAWLYQSIYQADPAAFTDAPPSAALAIGELIFFSLTTITTVGLSLIHPASVLAKFLVSAELVTGLVLIIGVFGVFIAQLAPTIDDVRAAALAEAQAAANAPPVDFGPAVGRLSANVRRALRRRAAATPSPAVASPAPQDPQNP